MFPHRTPTTHRLADDHTAAVTTAAPTGTQLLRLLVHQSGPQRTTVTMTERHARPVLHVRAGSVFTYASTPEVVAAHLAAWRDTHLAARLVLPADQTTAVLGTPTAEHSELSVIVRQDATPAVAVTRYPLDPSRAGRPACVETVTGPLSIRSYDRHSVADVLGVWMQAAALGAIVWGAPALADL